MSLFVIPAVTMRILAAEKGSGTLELLITMPVKDSEVILGKYLAALAMVLVLLAATLLYPIAMFVWPWHLGAARLGPRVGGLPRVPLLLVRRHRRRDDALEPDRERRHRVLHDARRARLPLRHRLDRLGRHSGESRRAGLGDGLAFISFQTRYQSFARGIIDTRAVVYFVSVTILCLLVELPLSREPEVELRIESMEKRKKSAVESGALIVDRRAHPRRRERARRRSASTPART